MLKQVTLLAMALIAVALVACAPAGGAIEDAADPTSAVPPVGTPLVEPAPGEEATLETPVEEATAEMTDEEATAETPVEGGRLSAGEVPQALFDAVVADALARSGATQSSVAVQTAEQVEWSDGSLGCPAPDMMYTQAIVNGYHVVLDVGGQTYDYRLSDRGLIILCENGLPVIGGE
jgi:hypothetical protein